MSRTQTRPRPVIDRVARWAILAAGWAAAGVGSAQARQAAPAIPTPAQPPVVSTPAPAPVQVAPTLTPTPAQLPTSPPGIASTAPAPGEDAEGEDQGLPHNVQIVRFTGPEGVKLEVLGPNPEPAPVGDGKGLATLGMKVGAAYRLRLSNLPNRPEAEIFPVVEVVGHLHRPKGIDPAKYPVRVSLSDEDIEEVVDRGRLVTVVGYLEDPDQAVPLKLGKDDPAVVSLTPAENPLKVASALGRVMVVVRLGGRKPTAEELSTPAGDGLASTPCPFTQAGGAPCGLPCGPVTGTPPPPGRPWMPRDEFLCDGGDRAESLHFGGDGGLQGIDPRDTAITFRDDVRPRVLPTNTVCIYAPRFAAVRVSVGPNEALNVVEISASELLQKGAMTTMQVGPKRVNQRQTAEASRHRMRPSSFKGRVFAGQHSELRVLGGFEGTVHVAGHVKTQGIERVANTQKAAGNRGTVQTVTLNRAESVVMTGIVEGASQTVMTWTPREVVGVEVPPNKPGIAIEKTVSVEDAEPGDTITFTITYRNMGNTPLRAVSIVDSLMPRLEYVAGSAQGAAGTIFTSGENRAGSVELRWDLPGTLAPGTTGSVTFNALVR